MTRATFPGAFMACFWLSLATIFAHAVTPLGSPLVSRTGSAFSAFTSDVALGPRHTADPQRGGAMQESGGNPDTLPMLVAAVAMLMLLAHRVSALPPRERLRLRLQPAVARSFQARAPPRL